MYIHTAFMAISQKNSAKEQIRFFGFSNSSQVTIHNTKLKSLLSRILCSYDFCHCCCNQKPEKLWLSGFEKIFDVSHWTYRILFCCRVGTKIKYFTIILEVLLVNKVYYFYEPVAWLFFKLLHPRWNQRLLLSIYVCPLNCY